MKRRPKLTKSWRRLHRSYTVILGLVLVVASASYEALPLFRSVVAESHFAWISMALGALIAVLRYVDQPDLQQPANPADDTEGEQ